MRTIRLTHRARIELLWISMRPRRSLLYVPGNDRHKIEKALTLGVDAICLDMEDGVAINRKAEARAVIAKALREMDFGRSERLVRINAIGTGLESDDLAAVLPTPPQGIVLPKVESGEQVAWVSQRIESAELKLGLPVNSIRLIVDVETAKGILNLKEIACQPRLDALIFGAEDFAADLGARRTPEAWEVFYARSAVVTAAAANGLGAIDMVTIEMDDIAKIRHEAEFGAQLGYTGKQIIHPNQVKPVQEAFTPSDQAIAAARRLVEAFEEHQKKGAGAFALDGKMIDMPLIKAARNVLERARAAGKI